MANHERLRLSVYHIMITIMIKIPTNNGGRQRLIQEACEKWALCLLIIEHMLRYSSRANGASSHDGIRNVKAVAKHNSDWSLKK